MGHVWWQYTIKHCVVTKHGQTPWNMFDHRPTEQNVLPCVIKYYQHSNSMKNGQKGVQVYKCPNRKMFVHQVMFDLVQLMAKHFPFCQGLLIVTGCSEWLRCSSSILCTTFTKFVFLVSLLFPMLILLWIVATVFSWIYSELGKLKELLPSARPLSIFQIYLCQTLQLSPGPTYISWGTVL